ncbi:hypothetical protein AB0L65_06335 [Nonomuraea sp. NPDC052116]|uniref:hypothetical protein n=1 Tax=Nonomuraea sp. NPDC052116 TaxID=3155665 RepID=UPI0034491295
MSRGEKSGRFSRYFLMSENTPEVAGDAHRFTGMHDEYRQRVWAYVVGRAGRQVTDEVTEPDGRPAGAGRPVAAPPRTVPGTRVKLSAHDILPAAAQKASRVRGAAAVQSPHARHSIRRLRPGVQRVVDR